MIVEPDIRHVLSHFPSPTRPRHRPHFLGNAGGLSGASLWLFDSELGQLILRAWPPEFQDRVRLERIDRWLSHVSHLGIVPVPILGEHGSSIFEHADRLWQLAPWLAGSADLAEPPTPGHVESAFHGLATLHQGLANDPDSRSGTSDGLRRRFDEIEMLLQGEFDYLEDVVMRAPPGLERELAIRWLAPARSAAREMDGLVYAASMQVIRIQPCIRDARRDHFLFSGSELTGIVDLGAMDLDCISGDLARLIGDWLGEDRDGSLRGRAIAAYNAIRPLDPTEIGLLRVFERSTALLAPGHWVRWHFAEGRRFEDPRAVAHGLSRCLAKFQRLGSVRSPWT